MAALLHDCQLLLMSCLTPVQSAAPCIWQQIDSGEGLRALCLRRGLFVIHYLVAQLYPPYRACIREFDRQRTWITVILVRCVVGKAVYPLFFC